MYYLESLGFENRKNQVNSCDVLLRRLTGGPWLNIYLAIIMSWNNQLGSVYPNPSPISKFMSYKISMKSKVITDFISNYSNLFKMCRCSMDRGRLSLQLVFQKLWTASILLYILLTWCGWKTRSAAALGHLQARPMLLFVAQMSLLWIFRKQNIFL